MKKEPQRISFKTQATKIKGKAVMILQDPEYDITDAEYDMLSMLISYLDKFLLHCVDEQDKLTNKLWISARLMEVRIVLDATRMDYIKEVAHQIKLLEGLIQNG